MESDRSSDHAAGSLLLDLASVEDHLQDLADRAAHHLGPEIDCSIILRHDGEDRRVASSSTRAAQCDDAESAAADGPCLTAMDELHSVVIPDVLGEPSWPVWRRQVLVSGYRSAAAFPAHVPPGADIALNLYSASFDPWTRDVVVHADLYAQEVARVAALGLDVARLTRAHSELAAAAETRRTVDLAVGVTMARRACTPDEALDELRATARDRGVEVTDVAREVLDTVVPRRGGR